MKNISLIFLTTLFLAACSTNDDIIIEGGCLGEYFLQNNTSVDLYVTTNYQPPKDDVVLIPVGESAQYAYVAGFNDNAEPVNNFDWLKLQTKVNDSLHVVFAERINEDSFWTARVKQVDQNSRCTWIYECQVTDSMIQ